MIFKSFLMGLVVGGVAFAESPTDYTSLQQESNPFRVAQAGAGVGQGGSSKWLNSADSSASSLNFEKVWGDEIFESSVNRLELRFTGLGFGWGLDGLVQEFGDLDGYDAFNRPTSTYKSGFNELGLSVSKKVSDFGLKVRAAGMSFRIDDKVGMGLLLGGHLLYANKQKPWSLGLELSNFGFADTPLGEAASLPWMVQAGAAYEYLSGFGVWSGFLDASVDRDEIYRVPVAIKWSPVKWGSLSTGYETLERESYPAAGLSLNFQGIEVSYTWNKLVELGSRHYMGILWNYNVLL
jgi:hypothetical protein